MWQSAFREAVRGLRSSVSARPDTASASFSSWHSGMLSFAMPNHQLDVAFCRDEDVARFQVAMGRVGVRKSHPRTVDKTLYTRRGRYCWRRTSLDSHLDISNAIYGYRRRPAGIKEVRDVRMVREAAPRARVRCDPRGRGQSIRAGSLIATDARSTRRAFATTRCPCACGQLAQHPIRPSGAGCLRWRC